MKKAAPQKNSKKIVKDKEKITEAVIPSVPLDTEKKGPEVEVIADYSGIIKSQVADNSVPESSEAPPAEPLTEEIPKVSDESEKTSPKESVEVGASEVIANEPKVVDADSFSEVKEGKGTKNPDVPSIAKDAPLGIDSAGENSEEETPKLEKLNKKILIIGVFVTFFVIILSVVFGFFFLKQDSKQEVAKEEKVEAIPTPTPKLTLDRSEWSLEVLNGTTTAGLAKELADKLETLGYEIVETGNADKKNYEKSQILVSDEKVSEEIELLLEDIKDLVSISSSSGGLSKGTASATIVIGSDYKSEN